MVRKTTRTVIISALLAAMILMVNTSVVGALGGIQNLIAHGGRATGTMEIAQTLVGDGVSITEASFTGDPRQIGTFGAATDQIGFEEGIILSTGDVAIAGNENDYSNSLFTNHSTNFEGPGDGDLTELARTPERPNVDTHDAAVLTLTFTPTADRVFFRYVFASEEYVEWVGTEFNDVFAFYVNEQNCALVGEQPNAQPVTINTINSNTNSHLYRANLGSGRIPGFAYDGATLILTCEAPVNPNVSNTLKLAIADADDPSLDSAVFIKAASFTTTPEVVVDDASGNEGSPIALTGTVTDPDSTNLTYSWAVDDVTPASVNCSVTNPSTLNASLTCDDQASVTISLAVDDGISPISINTGVVTVTNVSPTISNVTVQGSMNSVQLNAIATDPSSADVAAGLTYQWSVDNGPFVNGTNPMNIPFNQTQPGKIIRVIVVDKDGGQSAPYVVQVASAMDLLNALRADVQSSKAPAEVKSRLLNQLDQVRLMLILQQPGLTAVQLDVFIARVGMFSRAGVPRNDSTDFVQQAEAIKDVLGY